MKVSESCPENIGNYKLIEPISRNNAANLWKASHAIIGKPVTIQIIPKASLISEAALEEFQSSILCRSRMRHPFILDFYESFETDDSYVIVQEYIENVSLSDYVLSTGSFTESTARHYFAQLIYAVDFLHKNDKIMYPELDPENIFMDGHGNLRLLNFKTYQKKEQDNELPFPQNPIYTAPEIIKDNIFSQSADVWAIGIILFFMVAGRLPFTDNSTQRLLQKIVYQEIDYPPSLSPPLIDLLKKILVKNSSMRVGIDGIQQHHWFGRREYSILPTIKILSPEFGILTINKDIIDQLSSHGIDCHELHHQLLTGQQTPLVAMYRILEREIVTEMIDNVVKVADESRYTKIQARAIKYIDQAQSNSEFPGLKSADASQRLLPIPKRGVAQRRNTRPIVIRRSFDIGRKVLVSKQKEI